jgi:hypothetical protein
MLRRALDAVEGAKAAAAAAAQEEAETDIPGSESTSLANESETRGYGSSANTAKNQEEEEDGMDSHSYDEEDSSSYVSGDLWQEDKKEPLLHRCWVGVRECFTTIANVDSLWDDSEGNITRRNQMAVLFWFFVLASAYAGERSTFYLLVDRTGPFRLFSAVMITASHAVMLGFGMLVSAVYRRNFHFKALGIPIVDVGCTSCRVRLRMLLLFARLTPTLIHTWGCV